MSVRDAFADEVVRNSRKTEVALKRFRLDGDRVANPPAPKLVVAFIHYTLKT